PDRQMGPLDRARKVRGVLQPVVAPAEGGRVLGHERLDELDGLIQAFEPFPSRRERNAELAMLAFMPCRSDPELEAPARDMVDGDPLRGEYGRVAVGHARHQRAQAYPVRGRG